MTSFSKLLQKCKTTLTKVHRGIDKSVKSINTVKDVDGDIQLIAQAEEDASTAVNDGEPIVELAAMIPIPAMEALRPIDTLLKDAKPIFKDVLTPGVNAIASAVSLIAGILVPLLVLLDRRQKQTNDFEHSLDNAMSVTDQIDSRYPNPKDIPTDLHGFMTQIETALQNIDTDLDKIGGAMDQITNGLAPLDPVDDLNAILTPIVNLARTPLQLLHSLLAKTDKTMKSLDKVGKKFDEYGHMALSEIKSALSKAHIDTSFINTIETKVNGAVKDLINKIESPINRMRQIAESKLKGLKDPLTTLVENVNALDTHLTGALDPIKGHLDDYVAAAARHDIHPKP